MSGGRGRAGLKWQTARDDGGDEIPGGKIRAGEFGRNRERGRIRHDDRAGKMHCGADRTVVVGRAGGVAILIPTCRRVAGGLLGDAGRGRADHILGMDMPERKRQLQQQRKEPEARAEAPYRPQSAHVRHPALGRRKCYTITLDATAFAAAVKAVDAAGLSISRQRDPWATLPFPLAAPGKMIRPTELTAC